MKWLRNLVGALGLLSPTCRQATRLQSEARDRRLSFFEKLGLRLHLFLCKWCRRYGKQLEFLRSAARECEPDESRQAPQGLPPEARERIKEKLKSGRE
jgi:hypothetical protein